ncbi:MAG: ATP-dependent helicase, partial [Gemmatimonas sp.]
VGRTARAEAVGEAFTFVSPEEEGDLKQIERAISRQLPRVTVPGFDYDARVQGKLEVPLAERIAEIRKKKSEDRARSAAKQARRVAAGTPVSGGSHAGGSRAGGRSGGGRSGGGRGGRTGGSGAGSPPGSDRRG